MIESEPNVGTTTDFLVPTGRDYSRCVTAFEREFDLSVPQFPGRALVQRAGDRQYAKAKGKDIPALIAAGVADFGLVGSDICEEVIPEGPECTMPLRYRAIGEPMCTFELLFPAGSSDELTDRLRDEALPAVVVATSFPHFLGRCVLRAKESDCRLNIVRKHSGLELIDRRVGT